MQFEIQCFDKGINVENKQQKIFCQREGRGAGEESECKTALDDGISHWTAKPQII